MHGTVTKLCCVCACMHYQLPGAWAAQEEKPDA